MFDCSPSYSPIDRSTTARQGASTPAERPWRDSCFCLHRSLLRSEADAEGQRHLAETTQIRALPQIHNYAIYINWGYGAMNYRQVEVFKAIMDCGSITEAAAMLRISQPAVSKALKLLEGELGLRLFTRTTKGIAATEEARALYAEVERTYFGMQNLARFAANLRDRKQGRIVVTVRFLLWHRLASGDGGAVRASPSRM